MDHPSSTHAFPFGRPLVPITGGDAAGRECLILGNVPGALCIRWRIPGGKMLQGLVVDSEPSPLWDGHDQESRVRQWCEAVCWQEAWGEAAPSKNNGVDGQWLNQQVLSPLNLTRDRVCIATLLDTHHANDAMLHRIEDHYHPLVGRSGVPPCALPRLPGNDALIAQAVGTHGDRLKGLLRATSLQTVVTLGTAAMRSFLQLLGWETDRISGSILTDGMLYGQPREVAFEGRGLRWFAFVNPNAPMSMQTVHRAWAEGRGMKPLVRIGAFK